jgi:hypothetical protein
MLISNPLETFQQSYHKKVMKKRSFAMQRIINQHLIRRFLIPFEYLQQQVCFAHIAIFPNLFLKPNSNETAQKKDNFLQMFLRSALGIHFRPRKFKFVKKRSKPCQSQKRRYRTSLFKVL